MAFFVDGMACTFTRPPLCCLSSTNRRISSTELDLLLLVPPSTVCRAVVDEGAGNANHVFMRLVTAQLAP